MLLLLLLLCSCLCYLREGVWTRYTAADVAQWRAQPVEETTDPRLSFQKQRPATAHLPPVFSDLTSSAVLCHETAAPANKSGPHAA